ncbi:MAG: radical SAM protein [Saprospiraceae bacterium]
MSINTLLITPPFTQLNTPYPATAYLKGFLNTKGYASTQVDLGIEVILELFSRKQLTEMFKDVQSLEDIARLKLSDNALRILRNRQQYLQTITPVLRFLQHKNPTLAHRICDRTYLPEARRFADLEDLEWAFGTLGTHDKARHLATLYLEDLGDFIKETTDPHFGFSRYAERLGRTMTHFGELDEALQKEETIITRILIEKLENRLQKSDYQLVALSVPFPGNLFGAFKIGQYIKQNYPQIKIALGGGYANTELRSLGEECVFDYLDFVTLDDGELPFLCLLEHIEGKREVQQLKRTFVRQYGVVAYCNGATELDIPQRETGTPDYADFNLRDYLSVIEVANPMHRMWSDGRWNKLTLAHGCYWGKCSFCDVTLDYIKRYEPVTAAMLCDRIETIIEQTGENGFHFVDEAAPPALMRDLALEIIRRGMTVVWWTNIRFEKSFTPDLCRLLKASGCVAVSGGLEVASDRLLALMEKGVTVAQVARVADAFTEAGILVHAYLMYGFPTQTTQETIDALEMVRQLFQSGVVQSGFWHRFAMTAHSPVGLHPEKYQVEQVGPAFGGFAENDYYHEDPQGADHDLFAEGLRVSLFNYMHGAGFDLPLRKWFDFKTPVPTISPRYIERCLQQAEPQTNLRNKRVVWLGQIPEPINTDDADYLQLNFYHQHQEIGIELPTEEAQWWLKVLSDLHANQGQQWKVADLEKSYEKETTEQFQELIVSEEWGALQELGLVIV